MAILDYLKEGIFDSNKILDDEQYVFVNNGKELSYKNIENFVNLKLNNIEERWDNKRRIMDIVYGYVSRYDNKEALERMLHDFNVELNKLNKEQDKYIKQSIIENLKDYKIAIEATENTSPYKRLK